MQSILRQVSLWVDVLSSADWPFLFNAQSTAMVLQVIKALVNVWFTVYIASHFAVQRVWEICTYSKSKFPGNRQSMQSYILNYSRLTKETLTGLDSKERGSRFLCVRYFTVEYFSWLSDYYLALWLLLDIVNSTRVSSWHCDYNLSLWLLPDTVITTRHCNYFLTPLMPYTLTLHTVITTGVSSWHCDY